MEPAKPKMNSTLGRNMAATKAVAAEQHSTLLSPAVLALPMWCDTHFAAQCVTDVSLHIAVTYVAAVLTAQEPAADV